MHRKLQVVRVLTWMIVIIIKSPKLVLKLPHKEDTLQKACYSSGKQWAMQWSLQVPLSTLFYINKSLLTVQQRTYRCLSEQELHRMPVPFLLGSQGNKQPNSCWVCSGSLGYGMGRRQPPRQRWILMQRSGKYKRWELRHHIRNYRESHLVQCWHDTEFFVLGPTDVFDIQLATAKYDPSIHGCHFEQSVSILEIWSQRTSDLLVGK